MLIGPTIHINLELNRLHDEPLFILHHVSPPLSTASSYFYLLRCPFPVPLSIVRCFLKIEGRKQKHFFYLSIQPSVHTEIIASDRAILHKFDGELFFRLCVRKFIFINIWHKRDNFRKYPVNLARPTDDFLFERKTFQTKFVGKIKYTLCV